MANVFAIHTYIGTGATLSLTGIGFQPDMVWIINRGSGDTYVFDSVRGATKYWVMRTNALDVTDANSLTSFDADGFTLGTASIVNASGSTFAAYCFKKTSGFVDIIQYTGTGSAHTEAHNLGAIPESIWVKKLSVATANCRTYHKSLNGGTTPEQYYIELASSAAEAALTGNWNDTAPTSSVFTVGTNSSVNANTASYIAYLFGSSSSSGGVIQQGHFTTSSGAATISLDFDPQVAIFKSRTAASSWACLDVFRGWESGTDKLKNLNSSGSETTSVDQGDPGTAQFTVANQLTADSYIYMAFKTHISVTAWTYSGTKTDAADNGNAWSNTANIDASDNTYATCSVNAIGTKISNTLNITNCSFSIPSGATIYGVEASIEGKASTATRLKDNMIQLIKGGATTGTNIADSATFWTTSDVRRIYGGTNLWGATLSNSDVNASNFGLAMAFINSGATATMSLDDVKIRVFYIAASASASGFNPYFSRHIGGIGM